ncbi:MAG: GntR family transcriptional regulator [Glaciihabitans sp.]|jgi:GntR family transcriptional repressor for pyruvate dehydrogenase complex|nr:GntR family transcriptional regulator [Glaciihabitans sp.]
MATVATSQPTETAPQESTQGHSQTDVVLQGIKSMITSGELGPGSRLPIEKDLAISLGVSRGSLREGVRALCIMGVLETRQGDGTYVTSLDSSLLLAPMGFMIDLQTPEHRHDLHSVRRVLEAEAAARAALYITDEQLAAATTVLSDVEPLVRAGEDLDHEAILDADIAFHHIVAHGSNNSALAALIDALANRTSQARLWLGLHNHDQVRNAHGEHLAILAALRARQPDRARLMMDHHLLVVEDSLNDAAAESN